MPRNITPSDIDASIDNNGTILMLELNSKTANWPEISEGQRRQLKNYVKAGRGKISAALLQHRIPDEGVQIDTIKDVTGWSWLYWEKGQLRMTPAYGGDSWTKFIQWWLKNGDTSGT